jgi:hypothetical protein
LPAKAGLRALDEIENEAKQKVATTAQTELLGSIGRPPSEVYTKQHSGTGSPTIFERMKAKSEKRSIRLRTSIKWLCDLPSPAVAARTVD